MATITSGKVVDELIELLDREEQNLIYAIVEYKNFAGEIVWGITWPHDPDKNKYMTHQPPYVNHPRIVWCKSKELVFTRH